jgi:hypothetical protein
MVGDGAQVSEHMPSKYKALSSNPNTIKTKTKQMKSKRKFYKKNFLSTEQN